MRRWGPLSERQLELLRRIGNGDDLSGPDGVPYRNSARALQKDVAGGRDEFGDRRPCRGEGGVRGLAVGVAAGRVAEMLADFL